MTRTASSPLSRCATSRGDVASSAPISGAVHSGMTGGLDVAAQALARRAAGTRDATKAEPFMGIKGDGWMEIGDRPSGTRRLAYSAFQAVDPEGLGPKKWPNGGAGDGSKLTRAGRRTEARGPL